MGSEMCIRDSIITKIPSKTSKLNEITAELVELSIGGAKTKLEREKEKIEKHLKKYDGDRKRLVAELNQIDSLQSHGANRLEEMGETVSAVNFYATTER